MNIGENVKIFGVYGIFIGDLLVDMLVFCLVVGIGLVLILVLVEVVLCWGFKKLVMMFFLVCMKEDVYSWGMMVWWCIKYCNFDYKIMLICE